MLLILPKNDRNSIFRPKLLHHPKIETQIIRFEKLSNVTYGVISCDLWYCVLYLGASVCVCASLLSVLVFRDVCNASANADRLCVCESMSAYVCACCADRSAGPRICLPSALRSVCDVFTCKCNFFIVPAQKNKQ